MRSEEVALVGVWARQCSAVARRETHLREMSVTWAFRVLEGAQRRITARRKPSRSSLQSEHRATMTCREDLRRRRAEAAQLHPRGREKPMLPPVWRFPVPRATQVARRIACPTSMLLRPGCCRMLALAEKRSSSSRLSLRFRRPRSASGSTRLKPEAALVECVYLHRPTSPQPACPRPEASMSSCSSVARRGKARCSSTQRPRLEV